MTLEVCLRWSSRSLLLQHFLQWPLVAPWFEKPLWSKDCMVYECWIFTFLSWFLKVIFRLKFFPSNLVKASNIFLGVFNDDTWGMRWYLIEYAIILLYFIMFLLWVSLASSPFGSGISVVKYLSKSFSYRVREILYFHAWKLSAPSSLSSTLVWLIILIWEPQMEIVKK